MKIWVLGLGLALLTQSVTADFANESYSDNQLNKALNSTLVRGNSGYGKQNQPAAYGGYLVIGGNALHTFVDVNDPYNPKIVKQVKSPSYQSGKEQENHQISFAKYPDGNEYLVTISGVGLDIWDVTDIASDVPHVKEVRLPGINYGDVDGAVWGVGWQGKYLYVGATNRGIYVLDMTDVHNPIDAVSPSSPNDFEAIPTRNWNNIKAGPLFPLGNLLAFGAPKDANGVVTLDISNPGKPVTLDSHSCVKTTYITGFYGKWIFCEEGIAIYDVTTNPRDIKQVGSTNGPASEYMSFGDDFLFLGGMRPNGGVYKYDLSNISNPRQIGKIVNQFHRDAEVDDQFSVPIGNLIYVTDDQKDRGGFMGVHDTNPDTKPPRVMYANPSDGTTQPTTTRIGLSLSDQIDMRSVDYSTVELREISTGVVVEGYFGINHTVLNFSPLNLLNPNSEYELYLPQGGIKDLVGNGLDKDYTFRFKTSDQNNSGDFGGEIIPGNNSGTPTPPDTNGRVQLEAENLSYSGGVATESNNSGFSGTGFADFPSSGGSISQQIQGDLSGNLEVQIRYANGESAARSLTLDAGGKTQTVNFPTSGGWTTWNTVTVNIQGGGSSAISLHGGSGPGPNVDSISVSGVQPGEPSGSSGTTLKDCQITASESVLVGSNAMFMSTVTNATKYTWTVGDERFENQTAVFEHEFIEPGRYFVSLTISAGAATKQCTKSQIVHHPLTTNRPTRASPIIVDETNNRVWNVNPDNNTISAVNQVNPANPETVTKLVEIPVGEDPRSIAQAANGDLWVVNHDDASISIVNPSSNTVTQTVKLPYASQPFAIVFNPSREHAFVSLQAIGQIAVLNGTTAAVEQTIKLDKDEFGFTPKVRGLAVSADDTRLYATRFVSNDIAGDLYEFDALNFTLLNVIKLTIDKGVEGVDEPDDTFTARGLPNYINSISITPDGRQAWVTAKKDNIERGLFSDGREPTFDSTTRAIIAPVDLETGVDLPLQRIDFNDADSPMATVFSPYGDIVFTAIQGNKEVHVYDVRENESIAVIDVGFAPQGMVLDSEGYLYVHNFISRSVSVIDVADLISGSANVFTKLAEVPVVANEILSATVLEGKQIFYNSRDVRMTQENYISCATCHLDGAEDGRVFDFANRGEGMRNTISLRGRRGTGHGPVHWTGNFDEIQDFEHDMRGPFGGTGFIDNGIFASGTVSQSLGDPKEGLSKELDALAEYVTTLDRVPNSPFRNADGSLTQNAREGKRIYERLDCATCHSGPDYTDSALNVHHHVGTTTMLSGSRLGDTLPGFDTPTLKGVWNTPPYFHDGSAKSLLDTLNVPDHGNAQNLSAAEKDLLVTYLLQIDENSPQPDGNNSPPETESDPAISVGSVDKIIYLLLILLVAIKRVNSRRPTTARSSGSQSEVS